MERTYIVEECLFDDLFDDVIAYLQEKSGKEIPEWRTYELDFVEYIEYIYPIRRYHVTLREGPPEYPGKVVAHISIEILIEAVEGEEKAVIFIKQK